MSTSVANSLQRRPARKRRSRVEDMTVDEPQPIPSNTASMADYWMPTRPGTESAALLAMASVILAEKLYDADFLRRWVNWEDYLRAAHPDRRAQRQPER